MQIKISLLLALNFLAGILYSQPNRHSQFVFNINEFNTVFKNQKSGQYTGTANGVLLLKNTNNNDVILDFQGSSLNLELLPDEDEVYDVSWKNYTAYSTSGKTKIKYRTYAYANELTIDYQNQTFAIGSIDGACDMQIAGLSCTYVAEKETEYLILIVKKELWLSNYHFLMENINYEQSKIEDEVVKKEQFIRLLPNAVIVFAVKRE